MKGRGMRKMAGKVASKLLHSATRMSAQRPRRYCNPSVMVVPTAVLDSAL